MSFSWSAPQVTTQDETLERASLTADERCKIVNDLYGSHTLTNEESAGRLRDALHGVNSSLLLSPPPPRGKRSLSGSEGTMPRPSIIRVGPQDILESRELRANGTIPLITDGKSVK